MAAGQERQKTADYWIQKLGLIAHPGLETGYFAEVYRDEHKVMGTAGAERSAGTHIYFLHKEADTLGPDTVFFRTRNSELMHYYQGTHPVQLLHMPDLASAHIERQLLGPDPEQGHTQFFHLPRDHWYVHRLEVLEEEPQRDGKQEAFALIGCSVVPGYDNQDLEMATLGEIQKRLAD